MNLSEYISCDALELASLVRKGAVSPRELAENCLQLVEKFNPQINAVIETYPQRLEELQINEQPDGTFGGVPFLLKDIGAQEKGSKNEMGSRLAAGTIAGGDTDLVARYKAAGLVNLGRTSTPEFGFSCTTEAVATGPTRNPWDTERMTGGSSGGAAAVVAAGIVPAAHANDAGGSIRNPASCCGLVGLKPTRGRTPAGPYMAEVQHGMAIEHALTRTVRDTAAMLDISTGPGVGDPFVIPAPDKPFLEEVSHPPGKLKIAFTSCNWTDDPVDSEYQDKLRQTADLCSDLGHEVEEASPQIPGDDLARANIMVKSAWVARFIDLLCEKTGRKADESTLEFAMLDAYRLGREMKTGEYFSAVDVFNTTCRVAGNFFEHYDVLLTPTTALPAQPIGTYNSNQRGMDIFEWGRKMYSFAAFTLIGNVTGLPAISLPLHQHSCGVPVGMQFIGRFTGEATLIRLASQLEQACPWHDRHAPILDEYINKREPL